MNLRVEEVKGIPKVSEVAKEKALLIEEKYRQIGLNLKIEIPEHSRLLARMLARTPGFKNSVVHDPKHIERNETEFQLNYLDYVDKILKTLLAAVNSVENTHLNEAVEIFFGNENDPVKIRIPEFKKRAGKKLITIVEKRGHVEGKTEVGITGSELVLSLVFKGIPVIQLLALTVAGYKVGMKTQPFISTDDNETLSGRELNLPLKVDFHDIVEVLEVFVEDLQSAKRRGEIRTRRIVAQRLNKYSGGEVVPEKVKHFRTPEEGRLECAKLKDKLEKKYSIRLTIPGQMFDRLSIGRLKPKKEFLHENGLEFYRVYFIWLSSIQGIFSEIVDEQSLENRDSDLMRKLSKIEIVGGMFTSMRGKVFSFGGHKFSIPLRHDRAAAKTILLQYLKN